MGERRRFWMRWFSPDPDPRPVVYPAPVEWWCTGYSGDNGDAVICAVADFASEDDAWQVVQQFWPGSELSFCEPKPTGWRPSDDRFPAATSPDAEGGG